jgi:hypothetical protein
MKGVARAPLRTDFHHGLLGRSWGEVTGSAHESVRVMKEG